MSDEQGEPASVPQEPVTPEYEHGAPEQDAGAAWEGRGRGRREPESLPPGAMETLRLWLKGLSWVVLVLGGALVLAGLYLGLLHNKAPFLAGVGVVLIGASFVLAGQALGEGYAWPAPLCAVALFMLIHGLPGLLVAWFVFRFVRRLARRGLLRFGVTENAPTAFGLFAAGLGCLLVGGLLHHSLAFTLHVF